MQFKYKPQGQFKDSKCVYCVHNIAFQGRFWPESMGRPGRAAGGHEPLCVHGRLQQGTRLDVIFDVKL